MKKILLCLICISVILVSGCIQPLGKVPAVCGDGVCNGAETCTSCRLDCGVCKPVCGNNICETNETCSSCPTDCGACSSTMYCGDKTCNGNETCSSCPADCGVCSPVCGNKICEFSEKCSSCPGDCGTCPTSCGNGICELTEDCNNCAKDCGCSQEQYCSTNGICRSYVCGDGICSANEKDTCCKDCGCAADQVCNDNTQKCQIKSTVSEIDVTTITNNYLKDKNITGTIANITDIYYENQTVKQVTINCRDEKGLHPYQIMLIINNIGSIIKEMVFS